MHLRRNKNRVRRSEALERRDLLSAVVMESEPNDRARTADVAALDPADGAAKLVGRIANTNDQDFFRFTAPATGAVHLEVQSSGGLRGQVSVENARGVKQFETEPNNGINAGDFNAIAGQDYFVRVRAKNKTTGDYRVTVDAVLASDPGISAAATNDAVAAIARASTASTSTVKLEGALVGSAIAPRASGKGSYEQRGDRVKLSVEVEDLRGVSTVEVRVNGAVVGTARVNALGTADLNLDSRLGHKVPSLATGATIEVFNPATGQLLVSGSLRSR